MTTPLPLRQLLSYGDRRGISLFLPRSSDRPHHAQMRFRALVIETRAKLAACGVSPSLAEELLRPAVQLGNTAGAWLGARQPGLALFLAKGVNERVDMPFPCGPLVMVGFGFHIRPLFDLPTVQDFFLVLTVHKDRARLYSGTRFALQAIGPVLPRHDVTKGDRERTLQHKTMGSANGDISYSSTSLDQAEHDETYKYYRTIGRLLNEHHGAGGLPLVLVGPVQIVSWVSEALESIRPPAGVVHLDADGCSVSELHRRALLAVEPALARTSTIACERYGGLPTNRRSTDLATIMSMAADGRVDTLFADRAAIAWGQRSDPGPTIIRHAAYQANDEDLINHAMIDVLLHGGVVRQVSRSQMPEDSDIAAILRY